jgi:nucleoside-diphosphate-sugar epimerase
MACISVARVVESLVLAMEIPATVMGADRTLLLTGIPVSAQQMLEAVRNCAGGRTLGAVRFEPDPAAQAIMDSVARSTYSARAAGLGFRPSASIEEIITEYLERRTA